MARQLAAAEAAAYGWGGLRAVSEATGMSPHTIRQGLAELAHRAANLGIPSPARVRRLGGGRKRCTESDPELTAASSLTAIDRSERAEETGVAPPLLADVVKRRDWSPVAHYSLDCH